MGYPSLPASVDRYVRQMLDTMAGRTGNMGDKVVTLDDLAKSGLLVAIPGALNSQSNPNKNINDALTNTNPETDGSGNVVTPGTEPADPPTTPEGLISTRTFGAVILSWVAPSYAGHSYTEVYRAQIDDPDQAIVVHQEPTVSYADVTGNTTTNFYWIRHVNKDGAKSQFNQVAGVAGAGTALIAIDDLVLEHPEILQQPFTVMDNGEGSDPRYVIALNGDIAINGAINISQLVSGELADGTALTIGQGSIEFGTASDGTGQMLVTGTGGIQNNDYMILNAGRISSYVFVPGVGHVPYKEVKRIETGTANSGQQIKIPAYFRSQPTVHLYPRDLSVYNADYSNQSQKIEIYHSAPQPDPTEDGAWLFTPYAKLVLAAGSETVSPGWTYAGGSNAQTWTTTSIGNLKAVTVSARCASYRRTTGTTYQNRQVAVYLDYKLSSSSSWINASSETVSISKFTTHDVQLSKDLTQNTYDIRVRFVAADGSGSFTDGSPSYNYTSQNKTGTSWTYLLYAINKFEYAKIHTQNITINSHALTGWEITRIDYLAKIQWTIKARTALDGNWVTNDRVSGNAFVDIPNGSGGAIRHSISSTTSDFWLGGTDWNYEDNGNADISWSDASYKDGIVRPPIKLYTSQTGYFGASFGNQNPDKVATGYAEVIVTNITAIVNYRQQQSNPATYNNYYLDAARYDKSATDISLNTAVVTWMASSDN